MPELARAKVNLTLHITGKRADGYHLLDSIVVFPEVGDLLHRTERGFTISGPFSDGVPLENNLVTRAAALVGVNTGFHLEKNLPVASGIGGGSADAAAALRLLSVKTAETGLTLGADVPACFISKPLRMQGIGEKISRLPPLPACAIVLVNAGLPVSTSEVFSALKSVDNPESPPPPKFHTNADFFRFIQTQRNDMQAAALEICPEISNALKALETHHHCAVARMSGSGGTCFGLFETVDQAKEAAALIKRAAPNWWVAAAKV